MKSKTILFIADMFTKDINGGAESNDSVLISHLRERGYDVKPCYPKIAHEAIREYGPDVFYIVGNFVSLPEETKRILEHKCEYVIYEHDHKYVKTRDPSKFKDFNIPEDQIINKSFYEKAKAVVVLSKVCKEVIEKNLGLTNVHNIGTSLWSDERLDFISDLSERPKHDGIKIAYLRSLNPTKGTKAAEEYLKGQGLKYDEDYTCAYSQSPERFLEILSKYEKFVFIPQVLETFCRLACEAKMLNCKLITKPNLLGFASEECFNLSGEDLIEDIRKRKDKALKLFEGLIEKDEKDERDDITVILNCYKRPHLLEEQIKAIQNQSIKPKEIWVWLNQPEDAEHSNLEDTELFKHPEVKTFSCNHNWKYHGRFTAALLARTKYIAMFDDDTIPAVDWFKNCLETMKEKRGILGGVGCRLKEEKYFGHERIGWSTGNHFIEEVDLVGHAWFFEKEWLKYFWMEEPFSWDNGEDIHFSYTAQKYGGIKTYVPSHMNSNEISSTKGYEYGVDEVASSATRNHSVFYKQRDEIVKNAVDNGWKLVMRGW